MTVTLAQAQAELGDLIRRLAPGDLLTITDGDRAVARLWAVPAAGHGELRPPPGLLKGMIEIPEDDDDEHLKDFEEYMP
jgi:antitoxin (DNA-binding transcriptional repressor) of toxin-antitoxin stability system